MGNAVGNLVDYWNAIESTNFFMGGAIWDWVDQALYNVDSKTGKKYWGYGGDFGMDNKPNDGMFCMNGIMRPDLSPKAQYFEVKKVYQNVGVKAVDMTQGRIEIFNKNYFEPLRGYQIVWSLWKDGECIKHDGQLMGAKNIVGPRERQEYTLDYDYSKLDPQSEYFVKVQFLQGKDMPWAKKGYVQMEEQLRVKGADMKAVAVKDVANAKGNITFTQDAKTVTVNGDNFNATFSLTDGALNSLSYGGNTVFAEGNGPKLDAFRAPTDNDAGIGYHNAWFKFGLYDLDHHVVGKPSVMKQKDGSLQISMTVESQGKEGCKQVYSNRDRDPESAYTFNVDKQKLGKNDFKFTTNQVYTIYKDGSIELNSAISANRNSVILPRIGYAMKLPNTYKQFDYYGRGPVNNYNDRKTGQFIEHHRGIVGEQDILLPKPQSMGNREEVRWCALTEQGKQSVVFVADSTMSVSALPWSAQQMTVVAHANELPASDGTYLHLDAKVTGLGGASCGQGGPLKDDRTYSQNYNFGFVIRPAQATASAVAEASKVSLSGEQPIGIEHKLTGKVMLSTPAKNRTIVYAVNGAKKPMVYKGAIDMSKGGTITTWYKETPSQKTTMTFDKVDFVPLQIAFVSSEEPEEGDAVNLVDGDETTIWHTMYSITLAKYPHWVDFDASEPKTIKGFKFMPRQDTGYGRIKNYEIYVSNDGKTWGNAILKGEFDRSGELKTVMFDKPVKARYVRFRALNAHYGVDYASAAEFSLIAE